MYRVTFCVVVIIGACQLASATSDQSAEFDRMGVLKDVLWKTFMDWPSLQKALHKNSREDPSNMVDSLVHDTDDFLRTPHDVGPKEIAKFLGEMIETKLHTKILDGTVEKVGAKLSNYMDVIKDPKRMDWNEFRSRILSIENMTLDKFGRM